jgi:hypothetical protein
MTRIGRGWRLAKGSIGLVRAAPRVMLFPALGMLGGLGAAALSFGLIGERPWDPGLTWPYVLAFVLSAYAGWFVNGFFGVAFVAMVCRTMEGRPASIGEGLAVARTRIGPIAWWALLAAGVGAILDSLRQLIPGGAGERIAGWILGTGWTLVSFFAIPILALEGLGPRETLRRSAGLFRQRWGEQAAGIGGLTALFMLVCLPAGIVVGIGIGLLEAAFTAGVILIAIGATFGAAVLVTLSAVTNTFSLVLYRFATTGQASGPFSAGELEEAVRRRRRFGRRTPKD